MTKKSAQLFSVLLFLLFVLGAVSFARFTSAQEIIKLETRASTPALREIANYRQWIKATEKPLPAFSASDMGG